MKAAVSTTPLFLTNIMRSWSGWKEQKPQKIQMGLRTMLDGAAAGLGGGSVHAELRVGTEDDEEEDADQETGAGADLVVEPHADLGAELPAHESSTDSRAWED